MTQDRVDRRWQLFRAGGDVLAGSPDEPLWDVWDHTYDALEERERALRTDPGQPFLLRPDGSADPDILLYFHSYEFGRLALLTQLAYATDMNVYLSFLWRLGIDWRDATKEVLESYEYWRLRDRKNRKRVRPARFAREITACRRFYEWAESSAVIPQSPVALREFRRPDGTRGMTAALRPSDVRSADVKWLTRSAYLRWRQVSLQGYGATGRPVTPWRGRNDARNCALTDTMWFSGLRLREAATLLNWEVPEEPADRRWMQAHVARAVAKGSGRDFFISYRALRAIRTYGRTDRAEAVRRARRAGSYEALPGIMVATSKPERGTLTFTDERGQRGEISLDMLSAEDRVKVFVDTPDGLEPAMLWLTESGLPMPYSTWQMVFKAANDRCKAQGVITRCHSHMLRHSFALRMFLNLMNRPKPNRDPYDIMRYLLGHRRRATTEDIYLEPVARMMADDALNGEPEDDESADELFSRVAERSHRVQDAPSWRLR